MASRTPTAVDDAGLVYAVSFSHDGTRVAAAGDDGRVRIFDAATRARVKDLPLGDRQHFSVRFSADDRRIVTVGDDHVVQIADVANGQELSRMAGGSSDEATFTTAERVATNGNDGTLREWAPLEATTPPRSEPVRAVTYPSFTAGGKQVVSGDLDGGVHLWDLEKGDRTLPVQLKTTTVTSASEDGSRLVSASDDGTVRAYDVGRGEWEDLDFPAIARSAVAMSTTSRIAVAGDADKDGAYPIDIRDADGKHPLRLVGHTDYIDGLDFSPDGTRLVSASWDGTARIWDLAKGKEIRKIEADTETVRWVSYSDDAKRVATAGADGTIRIWPLDGGDPVVLVGHEGPVNTVEFNDRGDRVVSLGLDGTVRIWNASGGDTLVVLVRHRGTDGSGADFSPDGRYVVSSGLDGMRVTRCEVCGSLGAVQRLARSRAPRSLSASERERLDVRR